MKRLAFILPFIFAAAATITAIYLLQTNTLENNGRWHVTHLDSQTPHQWATAFFKRSQALAKGCLDLSVWHGFQEVFFIPPIQLKDLRFRFYLDPQTYFSLFYCKTEKVKWGLCLSANKEFPISQFKADMDGRFVQKDDLQFKILRPGWHWFQYQITQAGPQILVDDKILPIASDAWKPFTALGFRGCYHRVLIDNILAHQEDGSNISESFSNYHHAGYCFALSLALVVCVNGILYLILNCFPISRRFIQYELLFLNILTFVTLASAYGILYWEQQRYPVEWMPQFKHHPMARTMKTAGVEGHLSKMSPTPEPNTYRIFFLGTSQTFGEGATKFDQCYVEQFNRIINMLPKKAKNVRYECLKVGLSGADSTALYTAYHETLLSYAPHMVIIDLGNNDPDPEVLGANLNRILELNQAHNIKTVFLLEPNTQEKWPESLPNHAVMRKIAIACKIPCIDLHEFMKEHSDDGFLWSDFVHPTSFGHWLIAQHLTDLLVSNHLIPTLDQPAF